MLLKEAFLSSRFGQPARVSTSEFFDSPSMAGRPGGAGWFYQYCRLEMRLQNDKTYNVRGYYPLREAMECNTVATGLGLRAALGMLRDYQCMRMKAADFDPPGTVHRHGPLEEESTFTHEKMMKKRGRNHIDFVGPRHGVRPIAGLDAARLHRMRLGMRNIRPGRTA